MNSENIAIVLAGGVGGRFARELPKQFCLINSIPLFIYTLRIFKDYKIILTIPKDYHNLTYSDLKTYNVNNVEVIEGGKTRQESVFEALKFINNRYDCENVIITDACRPCIKPKTIEKGLNLLDTDVKCVVTVTKTVNTICNSFGEEIVSNIYNRTYMYDLLMPQFFKFKDIYKVHKSTSKTNATDDAQLLLDENYILKLINISLWEGFKLTNPEDEKIIQLLLNKEN